MNPVTPGDDAEGSGENVLQRVARGLVEVPETKDEQRDRRRSDKAAAKRVRKQRTEAEVQRRVRVEMERLEERHARERVDEDVPDIASIIVLRAGLNYKIPGADPEQLRALIDAADLGANDGWVNVPVEKQLNPGQAVSATALVSASFRSHEISAVFEY